MISPGVLKGLVGSKPGQTSSMKKTSVKNLGVSIFVPKGKDGAMEDPSQHPHVPVAVVNNTCFLEISKQDSLSEVGS